MSPLDRAAWRLADELAVAWRFGGALAIWCRNVSAAHVAEAAEVLAPGRASRDVGELAAKAWAASPMRALVALGVWS